MSDTPRTDEMERLNAQSPNLFVEGWAHSRLLERDLAEANRSLAEAATLLEKIGDERDAARDSLSESVDSRRWIPVAERLPDGGRQVVALNSVGYMACVTSLFRTPTGYDGEDAAPEEVDYPIGDVTHWMPLPEAPK